MLTINTSWVEVNPHHYIVNQLVISSLELKRHFAFVKGNRQINSKAVAAKVKSIREYGQLSPITVVKGEDVYLSGGHLVDLNGNDIPDEQTENYYAVLDGQHRLIAYLQLGLNLNDLVITEPLNAEMSIVALIAEMNICTTSWKGTDYMAAPCMAMEMQGNEVFEFALELRRKNYPLSTISLWCLGKNSLKPRDFVTAIKEKKLPKSFENTAWYQRSINWYRVAQEKFSETFLAKKYLIGYIINQGHEAEDPTAFYTQIEERIEQLTDEQAKLIMNPPKGLVTREQLIVDNLVEYLSC